MAFDPRTILYPRGLPKWFVWITNICLLPVMLWPLALVAGAMLFDHPGNRWPEAIGLFILIVSYPVLHFIIVHQVRRLFRKNRIAGTILALALLAALGYGLYILLK